MELLERLASLRKLECEIGFVDPSIAPAFDMVHRADRGGCLFPVIRNGDFVVVDERVKPEPGDFVVCEITGRDDLQMKQLITSEYGLRLQYLHPEVTRLLYNEQQFKILGTITFVTRLFDLALIFAAAGSEIREDSFLWGPRHIGEGLDFYGKNRSELGDADYFRRVQEYKSVLDGIERDMLPNGRAHWPEALGWAR